MSKKLQNFFADYDVSPIGFIAFDLDYYSSTKDAFCIFKHDYRYYWPRIECYMDDIGSHKVLCASQGTGVLLAIDEFNIESKTKMY